MTAIGVGTLIYLVVEFLIDVLIGNLPPAAFNALGNLSFLPSLIGLIFGASLIVPLFFGARYGPWVGLIVAFVGVLLGDWFARVVMQNIVIRPWDLAFLPLGFIASLAFMRTRGQYDIREAPGFGTLMGSVAILAHALWWAISDVITGFSPTFWADFVGLLLGDLPGVALLLVALLVAGNITRRRKAFQR